MAALPPESYGRQDTERVQTALVLLLRGDRSRLDLVLDHYHRDWRDVLVWSGLGQPDWPAVLDRELGPRSPSTPVDGRA
jgi:hypothetical protein